MAQLPKGHYRHRILGASVEVDDVCIEISKRCLLDSTSTIVKHGEEGRI